MPWTYETVGTQGEHNILEDECEQKRRVSCKR